MAEQAILVRITGKFSGNSGLRQKLEKLTVELAGRLQSSGLGEYDGEDFGADDCVLYMYGPDAKAIFGEIEVLLRSNPICRGAVVTKRYGAANDPDAISERSVIGE